MAADGLNQHEDVDKAKMPFIKSPSKVEFISAKRQVSAKYSRSAVDLAKAQCLKAEKSSRPTITRWKPQHKKAGDEFCQAALMFCEAGESKHGIEMLLRASECYKKKRTWHCAAKTLEQAMNLAQEEGDLNVVCDLAWRCAALHRKAGHPDTAAQVLERVSEVVEKKHPEISLDMLEKAAETVETENRPIQAACYIKKLLKHALHRDDNECALKKSSKLLQLYQEAGHRAAIGKAVVGQVALLLKTMNVDDAKMVATEFGYYFNSDQAVIVEDLINGFEDQEGHRIISALNSPGISVLGSEYSSVLDALKKLASKFPEEKFTSDETLSDTKEPLITSPIHPKDEVRFIDEEQSQDENVSSPEATKFGKLKEESENELQNAPVRSLRKSASNMPVSLSTQKQKTKSLKKRYTIGHMGIYGSKGIEIGGLAERATQYQPSSLPNPSPFVDVMGIEALNPAHLGMTTDQWREWKKSENYNEEADECYIDD